MRHALPRSLFLSASMLMVMLIGCQPSTETVSPTIRPVLAVQAQTDGQTVRAFAGEVRARFEPTLAFRVGGKVARREVDVGDRVKAGQQLAVLDSEDLRLQRQAAQAALAAAESDRRLAKSEFDRVQTLFSRQLVSSSLLDQRKSALDAAIARVNQARAQASAATNQAEYSALMAPKAGVIAERMVEAGQVIAAGAPAFVLAEDGEREIAIALPEQLVASFKPGMSVAIERWAQTGEQFAGTIREIAPAADSQTRTYATRVSFSQDAPAVEIGQSARVYAANSADAGIRIPLSALLKNDAGSAVWVIDPATSKLRRQKVEVGPFGDNDVLIRSGLSAGSWIVSGGVHLLQEGEQVAAVDHDNRPIVQAKTAITD